MSSNYVGDMTTTNIPVMIDLIDNIVTEDRKKKYWRWPIYIEYVTFSAQLQSSGRFCYNNNFNELFN